MLKRCKRFLQVWKPLPLCWWFEQRGLPIPRYFIGGGATAPSVSTQAATDVATTTATGNGNVTADGGSTTDWEQGFVWSVKATNADPVRGGSGVSEIVTSTTASTGAYTGSITALAGGTLYTYKAFAKNTKGTSYGAATDFTTTAAAAPTVTTQAVTDITSTTATGNGNVTADGGAAITERGVCWNTSTNPTTANSKATAAGTTGAFTASITGLTSSTLYYVRAYGINSVGTSYGTNVEFTPPEPPEPGDATGAFFFAF